jgi:hypothetical protein
MYMTEKKITSQEEGGEKSSDPVPGNIARPPQFPPL